MNQTLTELVACLKIRLRQRGGVSLNTQRFFEDRAYAEEMLTFCEGFADPLVRAAAHELRQHHKLDKPHQKKPTPLPAQGGVSPKEGIGTNQGRYMFGARS